MRTNSIISSSIGNILEWYDFGLFAIFSPILSELFFPKHNPHTALIETFSVFAIGFICRPIGALFFGYLGDRQGRAKTIRLSILMISVPTLLIGFLPNYHTIGILAPILLLLTRIWQGLSIGGEYSGNIIYLGELAPAKHKSLFTSFPAIGANIGVLLAMLVAGFFSYLYDDITFKTWGWRVPYIISGLFCLIIYATRLNLEETPAFMEMKKNHHIEPNPISSVFKKHRFAFMRIFGFACMGSTFYYFCFIYLPIVLHQNLHYSLLKITHLETELIAAMIILVPLAGYLNDRIGRYRMLLFNAIIIPAIIIPGLLILYKNIFLLSLLVLIIFTIASSLEQGTTPAVLVENFPVEDRYTGISLAYNLVNGFLGGTIPLICTWLVIHMQSKLAPGFYVTFCAVITLIFVIMRRYT
ncbi:MAG TPA: MFS transporter [Gammaproteobacteria bacterium]|nr:MFS transporter [Gammaproteobacteria bacterium]